ncbi:MULTISPECIES: hypothetical protein [unclassified Undibacterium]|uniref:hypothetical protein n=1 Tax=unclassified Undibacterium TaxID=2630295 RepID=UPI002AC96747|nr:MULTISPECIES: hypothetical protein [unclassified Undibacterium]MEB0140540.1 hypothetical protein [Undibacterium sp. CCC2.1]MEB0171792.1 hypothetical protein [Undibacterium sp. CCC1.1]MEB0175608.1 hypothetical protein [Undibacterium sp. CCC3.4]MEB0216716.1 hypothetical protein [Undibacterium sp. 5I2]WPX44083.1 hypothetical protein RHM61_02315 [Undibacterium sp. CCC3.4]
MTTPELAFRATTEQACAWLTQQTGTPWNLARLLEHQLTPYVWLDYDSAHAALFGDANGGYAAPIFFLDDITHLASGAADVQITMTKDSDKLVVSLPPPGWRRALHELRFQKSDLQRLHKQWQAALAAAAAPVAVSVTETQHGLLRAEVLSVFAGLLKIDLAQALDAGGGIFGDEGARIKASTRKGKKKIEWSPVTLALGFNEVYRVPLGQLSRRFEDQVLLHPWQYAWQRSLDLLGK